MLHKGKIGFTLAEVLITLGIIGVVAAITIPSLISNYKAHQLRSQFFKSYSTLQQVVRSMQADEISVEADDYKENASFYKTFMQYLQAPHDCSYASSIKATPCYYYIPGGSNNMKPYLSLDGKSTVSGNWFDDGQIALQDGSLLLFENPISYNGNIWVTVDLNGYNNLPNRWGIDLFTFQFVDGELKTMGDNGTIYQDDSKYCNLSTSSALNGVSCTHLAKTDADYFKKVLRNYRK